MKKIILTEPTICSQDEHEMNYYKRSGFVIKPELPKGTILEVSEEYTNFYGKYYKCKTKDGMYYIPFWKSKEILSL